MLTDFKRQGRWAVDCQVQQQCAGVLSPRLLLTAIVLILKLHRLRKHMTAVEQNRQRTAFVLGATADIGAALSSRLIQDGWRVVGTGRTDERLGELRRDSRFSFLSCDLSDRKSVNALIDAYRQLNLEWDLFITAAGTMEPIGRFFELDFDAWEQSITVNTTAQLRVLHGLWTCRRKEQTVDVMLMAGGGTNNPFTNYSAYCVAKIALIKMTELLDDEEDRLNIFIIGPGFVRTRIHEETLRAGASAGAGYSKTTSLLGTAGTSMDDIYDHLLWCMRQGRGVSGGRNFSTVHDSWREGDMLADLLRGDVNGFRLRRAQPGLKEPRGKA